MTPIRLPRTERADDWAHDRVALVTGGSSGIGLACTRELARLGSRVVVADLDSPPSDVLSDGQVNFVRTDISDPLAMDALGARIAEHDGGLDFGVNAAGMSAARQNVADYDFAHWRRVCGVNLDGLLLAMQLEIRLMRGRAPGCSIVNIASVFAHRGRAGAGAYVASKHAAIGLTKVAAGEEAVSGIRINTARALY